MGRQKYWLLCVDELTGFKKVFSYTLTEVCHIAHFWESYGRYAMPELPMGKLVGLSW